MFVCHPGYLDAYILRKSSLTVPRAMEAEMLCSDETKKYIEEQGIFCGAEPQPPINMKARGTRTAKALPSPTTARTAATPAPSE